MKVAITGGAGRQSLSAIYDLVETSDVEKILLIDINEEALKTREKLVNSSKVQIAIVDLSDLAALSNALSEYDVVLNGSSHIFNMDVMNACLESKTNYTDFGGLPILVPLWVLAQAIGISGLFAPVMSAWFWKRSTTAGAKAAAWGGGVVALAWAGWVWKTTGSPGSLVYGLHAGHVGLIVSIVLMIVVSLATKPEYEKALATDYKIMGDEMKKNTPEIANETGTGIFGWLGTHTAAIKILWVIVGVLFILHFILAFVFHYKLAAQIMLWTGLVTGVLLLLVLLIMGLKDIVNMVKDYKANAELREK